MERYNQCKALYYNKTKSLLSARYDELKLFLDKVTEVLKEKGLPDIYTDDFTTYFKTDNMSSMFPEGVKDDAWNGEKNNYYYYEINLNDIQMTEKHFILKYKIVVCRQNMPEEHLNKVRKMIERHHLTKEEPYSFDQFKNSTNKYRHRYSKNIAVPREYDQEAIIKAAKKIIFTTKEFEYKVSKAFKEKGIKPSKLKKILKEEGIEVRKVKHIRKNKALKQKVDKILIDRNIKPIY